MRISTIPPSELDSSPYDASPISSTPTKPTPSPISCWRGGSFPSMSVAMNAAKSGVAPFSIPVTADDTWRSASGNIESGIATQVAPEEREPRPVAAVDDRRVAGSKRERREAEEMRSDVMTPGANASRPIAMKKNDAPQMPPAVESSPQSSGVNASRVRALRGRQDASRGPWRDGTEERGEVWRVSATRQGSARTSGQWGDRGDLNPRPPGPQPGALTD